jgi:hypothetical protein
MGPVKVVHVCEPSMGLRAVLVVDNIARGHSGGKSVFWGDPRMPRENKERLIARSPTHCATGAANLRTRARRAAPLLARTSIRSIELPACFTWPARARRNRER